MIFVTDTKSRLSIKLSIHVLLPPTLQPHHKKNKNKKLNGINTQKREMFHSPLWQTLLEECQQLNISHHCLPNHGGTNH